MPSMGPSRPKFITQARAGACISESMRALLGLVLTCLMASILSSCMLDKPSQSSAGGSGRAAVRGGTRVFANDPSTVNFGYGRVMKSNPIILSGNPNLSVPFDFNTFLNSKEQDFITNGPRLESACGPIVAPEFRIQDCFKILKNSVTAPLLANNGKWAFNANSDDYLQVHTFYHTGKNVSKFQEMQAYAYSRANPLGSSSVTGGGLFATAIAPNHYEKSAHWSPTPLVIYSNCKEEANAFFRPSDNTVCFGRDTSIPNFVFSQDPDVIYHEVGHSFVKMMVNSRNQAGGVTMSTDLGTLFYDEGGAINEGLADYWSYVSTGGKTHFAEWALGRFYSASRPLSESDPLHTIGVSKDDDSRVSYPTFLTYDPNFPVDPYEDIHYAGGITGHFLVSFTDELINSCGFDLATATNVVLWGMMESLAVNSDLTSKATSNPPDGGAVGNRINLMQTNPNGEHTSLLWNKVVTPINYRSFYQAFARSILKMFAEVNPSVACPKGLFSKDRLEKVLDMYGLLLFKTYNDNFSGEATGHTGTLTQVNPANRQRSILIPKEHIKLNPKDGASLAFIFDTQADVAKILANLQANGDIVSTDISTLIPSDLPYNNGNGKISPGEILGVALNVYNDSNSTMAGVQVLANDWDHGKYTSSSGSITGKELKPCSNMGDQFPLESEGAAPAAVGTPVAGDCEYVTRSNGGDKDTPVPPTVAKTVEYLTPICFVQLRTATETLWVSQERFREFEAIDKNQCLFNRTGENGTNDCFIKVIPGAEQSYFSKINAKSTWGETLTTSTEQSTTSHEAYLSAGTNKLAPSLAAPSFQSSNLILMEVNPWTPPGTTFDCRFRVRFTNCEDCWHDPKLNNPLNTSSYQDDYLDYEYSGGDPFKILHLQFTVID